LYLKQSPKKNSGKAKEIDADYMALLHNKLVKLDSWEEEAGKIIAKTVEMLHEKKIKRSEAREIRIQVLKLPP
jgi:hypothetical protein